MVGPCPQSRLATTEHRLQVGVIVGVRVGVPVGTKVAAYDWA